MQLKWPNTKNQKTKYGMNKTHSFVNAIDSRNLRVFVYPNLFGLPIEIFNNKSNIFHAIKLLPHQKKCEVWDE